MTVEQKNGPAQPYQGPSANSPTQGHGTKKEQEAVNSEAEREVDADQRESGQGDKSLD
ncbi:hypothetical protein F471_04503 [Pseudomonas sp. URMO17WK12:I1]|uniref:hypothetical protein n=1 Tax=unclassified Pseudomonas TaxID=196821 RepID=UPI0004AE5862|nr:MULTISPECIES: hypothetical protein [unclassified Pseudomonas]PZW62871.1 hypothetical protein F471_04503 [Pseudomonas sp. URMO17WK12:I1]